MKSRRNKAEEHIDSHRWVVSYADFITLLFAFFVVMYAISSVNVSKYKSLSDGMKTAFDKKDKSKAVQSSELTKEGPEETVTQGTYNDGLDELSKSLSDLEDGNYKINRQDGWIELQIKAGSLFDSGEAELKAEALIKLMRLAEKISKYPYPVVIEGYTDNMPIETPQYPSNWELSATRAATVGRILNGYGIDTGRILVTGYGDQYPISTNMTEEGRSLNRRVNIIIAANRKIDRLINPEMGQVHSISTGNAIVNSPLKPQDKKPQDEKKKEIK
ncbi:flagellar motor protein MotB [Legionella worsleiensis]|uniref:Flagellar motor protein MotD n=1 Tax=Legionella worsleiensis TaxID=45076 RepID=A0A0W1A492_9GAMM|nr:flagellar motor protein MotB [Legionella worsleiensis]KTD76181.1 flagellar motor protein MotD [Legionella worsleiensis]STY33243.1 flagellar motor protein MotB [Legionella worsleiensis]